MRNNKSSGLDFTGLKQDNASKTISKTSLNDNKEVQNNDSEIELQEKSLAFLLKSIDIVDFSLEIVPKLTQLKKQINKLKKKVLDAEGNPIDDESKEYSKYIKLIKATAIPKLKKQEYSVLVINIFKKIVLEKKLDLKVYNKVIFLD